jgi:hypothetical protein
MLPSIMCSFLLLVIDQQKAARPAPLATHPQVRGPEEVAEPRQERPRPRHEGGVCPCQVDGSHLHNLHQRHNRPSERRAERGWRPCRWPAPVHLVSLWHPWSRRCG